MHTRLSVETNVSSSCGEKKRELQVSFAGNVSDEIRWTERAFLYLIQHKKRSVFC